jgi:hypothetical protein
LFITSLPGEARFCQDTLADLHYKAVFLSSAVKQIQHLESSRERLVQDNKTLETRVDILKDGLNAESALSEEDYVYWDNDDWDENNYDEDD